MSDQPSVNESPVAEQKAKSYIRVFTPEEEAEFRSRKGVTIRSVRMGKIRCPRAGCNSAFTYATPSKAWLQQEDSEINSDVATEIMVYRCRACGRGFNDLTKQGANSDSKLPPPGPERIEFLTNLLKKNGIGVK